MVEFRKRKSDGQSFPLGTTRKIRANNPSNEVGGLKIGSGTMVPDNGELPNDVAMPSQTWKEFDFQQTEVGLGASEPHEDFKRKDHSTDEVFDIVKESEINTWNNLTHKERGDVLNDALNVKKEDVSFYEITVGIRGFSKREREKVIQSANNISPEQHEWDLLDSAEEELQIHGEQPPFYKDDIDRLPSADQDYVNDGKDFVAKIRRIKMMKFRLLGKTKNESNPLREDVFRIKIEGFD